MSDKPLFQGMDEKEAAYAPEQLPNQDLPDREVDRGSTAATGAARTGDLDTTPVAVPLGTSGSAGAAPASDEFDPGMDRERHDLQHGDTDVIGPDPRDEQTH